MPPEQYLWAYSAQAVKIGICAPRECTQDDVFNGWAAFPFLEAYYPVVSQDIKQETFRVMCRPIPEPAEQKAKHQSLAHYLHFLLTTRADTLTVAIFGAFGTLLTAVIVSTLLEYFSLVDTHPGHHHNKLLMQFSAVKNLKMLFPLPATTTTATTTAGTPMSASAANTGTTLSTLSLRPIDAMRVLFSVIVLFGHSSK